MRGLATTLRSPPGLRRRAGAPFELGEISFSVRRGETVAVLGANGAGKTTLLRLVAGVYRPRAGEVRVRGRCSTVIGLSLPFAPELTVREHLRAYAAATGVALDPVRAVEFAGLAAAGERPVRLLSTGQRARLAIASGLLAPADLYLLDEALAVCDPDFRSTAVGLLERRVTGGAAVMIAGQDLLTARLVCRRALLLRNGRLALDAGLDEAIRVFTTPPPDRPVTRAGGDVPATGDAAPLIEGVDVPPAFADSGLTIPVRCRLRALPVPFELLAAVKGIDDAVIYSSRTVFGTLPEPDASGVVSVELGIPAGCVRPGNYRIAVAVADAQGRPLTVRDDAAVLRVAHAAAV